MGQILPELKAKFGPTPPEGLAGLLEALQQTLQGIAALPVPVAPPEPVSVPVPKDPEGDNSMEDVNSGKRKKEDSEEQKPGDSEGGAALEAAKNGMLGGFDIQASQLQPILEKLKGGKPLAKAKPAAASGSDAGANGRSRSPRAGS